MQWAIEAKNLVKNYGTTKALENINLNVKKGEIFGFLGPNGAGKTTFIKILLNFVFPAKGYAKILGIDAQKPAARKKVGFLPENLSVYPFLTVEEFLLFQTRLIGMSTQRGKNEVEKSLKITGLYNDRRRKAGVLSKGTYQRLGIAQALLGEPELLLFDEPTSGLDPIGIKEMRDIFIALKNNGKTIFINSHLLSEIEKTCDTVAILHRGKIIRTGSKKELSGETKYLEINVDGITEDLLNKIGTISSRPIEQNNGIIKIFLNNEQDSLAVHRIITAHGARLLSLSWKGSSLEEVFYQLVTRETNGEGNLGNSTDSNKRML